MPNTHPQPEHRPHPQQPESPAEPPKERPDPASPSYRDQVDGRLQGLLTGNQPRDPQLRQASTGRLILEGVVENVKIYRLYKEEKAREAKEKGKRKKRRSMGGHGHGNRDGERHRCRRHGEDRDGERHRRNRRTERSATRDRRDGSRGRDGSTCRLLPDHEHEHMMTGGAGPVGTLHSRGSSPEHGPRSRSRSRRRRASPKSGRASPTRRHGPDGKTPFGELPKKAAGVGFVMHALNTYRHIKAEHEAGHRSRSAIEKAVDGWRGKGPARGKTPAAIRRREPEKLHKKDVRSCVDGRSRDEGHSRHGDCQRDSSRRREDHERRPHRRRRDDMGEDGERGNGEGGSRNIHGEPDSSNRDKDLPRRPPTPHADEHFSRAVARSRSGKVPSVSPRAPSPPLTRHSELYDGSPPRRTERSFQPPRASRPPFTSHDEFYGRSPTRDQLPLPHIQDQEQYDQRPTTPTIHVEEATPPRPSRSPSPPWPPTPSKFMALTTSRSVSASRPEPPEYATSNRSAGTSHPGTPRGGGPSGSMSRSVSPQSRRESSRYTQSPSRSASPSSRTGSSNAVSRPPSRSVSPPYTFKGSSFASSTHSASPPYPETPRGRRSSRSPAMTMPAAAGPPPPPMPDAPAGPPPPPLTKVTPEHNALLDEISGGAFNLKPVRKADENSEAAYSETSHSRNVEDRERAQASNRTWTDEDDLDGDNESKRRRVLKVKLEAQFAGK